MTKNPSVALREFDKLKGLSNYYTQKLKFKVILKAKRL